METTKLQGIGAPSPVAQVSRSGAAPGGGFEALLKSRLGPPDALQFSKHAEQRMASRNVELPPDAQARLTQAVDRAAAKGARDSLVLMDRMAFLVNVPSRTVLTAMPQDQARGGVFTQIDSTVLA